MIEARSKPASRVASRAREKRKDAIGALAGASKACAGKDEKQHADQQKHSELDKYDDAAGQKRAPAIAFAARGEQALHNRLIGSVAGHGQECAADQAGPKRVLGGPTERKIEHLQFVAGGGSYLRDFAPSAWNAVQEDKQCHGAAGQIEQQLCDVGPDDAFIPPSACREWSRQSQTPPQASPRCPAPR